MRPVCGIQPRKNPSTRSRKYNEERPDLPPETTNAGAVSTSMLQQLQWRTLQCSRETAQVIMMYRIVYQFVDIPAEQHLNQSSLRTRDHHLRFLVPHTRTTVCRTFFFPRAIKLWNQLPARVMGANTLDSFKSQLFRTKTDSLLSLCFYPAFNLHCT
jgi:hypothetical protein